MRKHSKRFTVLASCMIGAALFFTSGCQSKDNNSKETNLVNTNLAEITFNNKLTNKGQDPWVIWHKDAYYYCYSSNRGVHVAKADNLGEIGDAKAELVWTPSDMAYCSEIWAPELHFIDGHWYIYVAADNGNNENHRMLCLEGTGESPLEKFQQKSVLKDSTDRWAIDGTVMDYKDKLYFIWSGWEGTENVAQNIYIAEMENPWTISSERTMISCPEYDWETIGEPHVNEGPTVLELNGTYHVVYSASGSWTDDYCLGMLTLDGKDPMKADAWKKQDTPVFSKTDAIFGPGHASFTTSPDGSKHFIVYHANEVSGSGWDGRKVWAQEFTVGKDNVPEFGTPQPAGTMQTTYENPYATSKTTE